jgi:hypothetical protein
MVLKNRFTNPSIGAAFKAFMLDEAHRYWCLKIYSAKTNSTETNSRRGEIRCGSRTFTLIFQWRKFIRRQKITSIQL